MPTKTIRIGCIVPSLNVTAEDEVIRMLPREAGVHFARAIADSSLSLRDQYTAMIDQLPALASSLSHAHVAVVAFACTSAGFFRGPGSDRRITSLLSNAAGVPAVTTATAVVDALTQLGARRVAVATPYVDWVCEAERQFLEAAHMKVTAIAGMNRRGGADINMISSDEVRTLVARVDSPKADAILISCTDLPAVHLIDEIETRHGKPVVTSNQATMWACGRRAGMGPITGFGTLLQAG